MIDAIIQSERYFKAVALHVVNGKKVHELCDDIASMKRAGEYAAAADLLYKVCIVDILIFRDSGFAPIRSWGFDQLRICLKKAGRLNEVGPALQAYSLACDLLGSEKDAALMAHLAKLGAQQPAPLLLDAAGTRK